MFWIFAPAALVGHRGGRLACSSVYICDSTCRAAYVWMAWGIHSSTLSNACSFNGNPLVRQPAPETIPQNVNNHVSCLPAMYLDTCQVRGLDDT